MAPLDGAFNQLPFWHRDAATEAIHPIIRSPRGRARAMPVERSGRASGGVEIDDQLKFGRQLYRQIGRFCAREDLSGVHSSVAICVREACSVAQQTPGYDEIPP